MTSHRKSIARQTPYLSVALCALLAAHPSQAQTAPASGAVQAAVPPEPAARDIADPAVSPQAAASDIVVTGTRVGRNGYDAPTPTTIIGSDLIEAKAPATIVDALVTLPAFKNSSTASTAGVGNSGSAGQSFANLRGLGANRTLVLLDGQRFVPSTSIATVDISVLPSALIQRVDIVTGGASAAYGSDAVAGVVNFVLDNRLTGLRGDFESGITGAGDNQLVKMSLAGGFDFASHGHLVVSGEYLHADGVGPKARPDTTYAPATLVTNLAYTPTNGQFRRLILPYVYNSTATFGGVITTGPLAGTEFGPGGSTFAQPVGQYRGTTSFALAGPANEPFTNTLAFSALPQERMTGYGRLSWDVAPNLTAYATGIVARNRPGPYFSTPANTLVTGAFVVQRDNAFLPSAVRAQMVALGLQTISVGRYSEDFGNAIISRTNDTQRGTIGLQGEIGGGWKVDAYAEYGHNRDLFTIANNAIKSNLPLAVDAVSSGGQIVCRSTIANPGNGCVPLNIFGPGAASAAAVNYIYGTSRAVLDLTQKVVAASISGEPVSTWAGPVSVAAGAEYRNESAVQTADPLSQAGAFAIGNPKALSGSFNVKEVFAETVVPLARNTPFLHSVDLNGAVRYTDYSTSGSVVTWKIGGNWEPAAGIRFRATRSRDIRAPNILELFSSPIQQTAFLIDPTTNTQPAVQTFSLGNAALRAEKADTTSAGVVLRPSLVPGFAFSFDYYKIEVRDAIATLALQDVVNRCVAGNQSLCSLITRTNGVITQINNPYLNLQSLKTDGFDVEVSYRRPVGPGAISARVLANKTLSFTTSDGVTSIDRAGDLSNAQPKWTGDATLGYHWNRFDATADINYIGGGRYDVTYTLPTDINDNRIGARTTVNFQVSLDVGRDGHRRQFFFDIANAFNVRPPAIFVVSGGPNYDRIGQSFRAGLRFSL